MAKTVPGPMPVIEWSSKQVSAVGAGGGQVATGESVQHAAQSAGLPRVVLLALSRRSAFVRTTHVPNVADKEIGQILSLQVGKLFPITQDKVAFSFVPGKEITQEGRVVSVFAASAETLKEAKEALGQAGHYATACVPAAAGAMALAESVGISDCAVVELNAEGLSIDIVKDGLLRYSRVAPRTTNPEAIQDEVCRTYSSVGLACGPILAAGGLNLSSAEFRSNTTTLEALARAGLGLGINIELPEEVAQREARQISIRGRLAALLCLAAITLGTMTYLDRADAAAEVAKDNAKWMNDTRKLRQIRDEANKAAAATKEASAKVRRAFEPAQSAGDILTRAVNLAPEGTWVTGVNFDRGKVIQIRGTAVNNEAVTQFLDALTAESRFRDVKLVFANNGMIEQTQVVNFSISAWAIGNVPFEDVKKKKGGATSK